MSVEVVAVGGLPKSATRVMEEKKVKKLGSGPKTPRLETSTPRSKRAGTPSSWADEESLPDQPGLPSYMRQTAASMNKRRTEVQQFTPTRSLEKGSYGEGGGRSTPVSKAKSFGGASDRSFASEVVGSGIIPKGFEPGRSSPLKTRGSAPGLNGKRSTTPQGKSSPVPSRNGNLSTLPRVRTGGKSSPPVPALLDNDAGKKGSTCLSTSKKSQPNPSEALVITDAVVDLDKSSPSTNTIQKTTEYTEPDMKKPSKQSASRSMKRRFFSCLAPSRNCVNYD